MIAMASECNNSFRYDPSRSNLEHAFRFIDEPFETQYFESRVLKSILDARMSHEALPLHGPRTQ